MFPCGITNPLAARRWRRLAGVAVCPLLPDEKVMLLAPHHAGEGLSLDVTKVVSHGQGADVVVKVVSLLLLALDDVVELFLVEVRLALLGEAEPDDYPDY